MKPKVNKELKQAFREERRRRRKRDIGRIRGQELLDHEYSIHGASDLLGFIGDKDVVKNNKIIRKMK
jgi:hypothetical protein